MSNFSILNRSYEKKTPQNWSGREFIQKLISNTWALSASADTGSSLRRGGLSFLEIEGFFLFKPILMDEFVVYVSEKIQ
jgi:hypothetical protein